MATDQTYTSAAQTRSSNTTRATDIVRAVLAPLSSLKLTVGLLAMSVFVIWVITLEQTTVDIWALKAKHFGSLSVWVPLQTFFPPNWFPNVDTGSFGLYLPSGLTLISLMLVNLIAAHLLRFRVQAKGGRLLAGLGIVAVSSLLTWAVIFNGQDAQGFQGKPPIPWSQMWKFLQIMVLGLAVVAGWGYFAIGKERSIERIGLAVMSAIFALLLAISFYYGEDAFIGDSAMRILWQLAQSTVAALAMLAGCYLLFRRKAGIVLLHLGIAGLLVNEIYVTVTNEEHRVSFAEGETVHHAVDLRETEFVVIDRSDDEVDKMTVIPAEMLEQTDSIVDDPRLPFKLRTVEYYPNCDVLQVGPAMNNQADAGLGLEIMPMAKPKASGADPNSRVNKASAYVEVISRENGQPIGTYFVSQQAYESGLVDTVEVDDNRYQIGLRFKTVYTPYSLKLKDTDSVDYVGTNIPKTFSSEFEINDPANGITSDQRIWMNNPLRYRDQTFYQTSYYEDPKTGEEVSGIQVVRNQGWMIPYVCCMFVVVGLVAQFQQSLSAFLAKSARRSNGTTSERRSWLVWLPTLLLCGIFGLYYASKFYQSLAPEITRGEGSDLRLDLLGRMPVTFGGRVQPLDSFARNTARQLSNRETVIDGLGNRQPAIRWLADMMFGVSAAGEYQILRIEDLNVQNALGLPRRKGLKYTFDEIRDADDTLVKLLRDADSAKQPGQLPNGETDSVDAETANGESIFHQRLNEVLARSRQLMGTRTAFTDFDQRFGKAEVRERLILGESLVQTRSMMPFAIPTDNDDEESWIPFSIALERQWLGELAESFGLRNPTVADLATRLTDAEMDKLRTKFVRKRIIRNLMQNESAVDAMLKRFDLKDEEELAAVLERNWDTIPEESYSELKPDAEKLIELVLMRRRAQYREEMAGLLAKVNGGTGALQIPDSELVNNLRGLELAYVDGNAEKFNSILETHLVRIDADQPTDYGRASLAWESAYNHFSPFHVASIFYLLALVVAIGSWVGFHQSLGRAAFALVCLALLIHLGGIVARVVISGRPPITNLYSSFVVVAAGCVVMLLVVEWVTRIGLGNFLAGACGYMSLIYAWTLSIDQGDTFSVLRAVLDTQFWLTTHVMIINLGYCATLVAGLVGIGFLLTMLLAGNMGEQTRRLFANIIYGIVCFALLFSFFGTVLGGLWADDSWGRFWGWDPKENGALMIVFWNALILHARWAGIVRYRGLAALAVIGNVITIWSWLGVNELGVGLHAYGGVSSGASAGSFLSEPMFWVQAIVLLHLMISFAAFLFPAQWFASQNSAKSSLA